MMDVQIIGIAALYVAIEGIKYVMNLFAPKKLDGEVLRMREVQEKIVDRLVELQKSQAAMAETLSSASRVLDHLLQNILNKK